MGMMLEAVYNGYEARGCVGCTHIIQLQHQHASTA